MKQLALVSVALAALTGPALATTYIITSVAASYPDNSGIVVVPGNPPPPWTTPMLFTASGGQSFVVFCDDLGHNVFIEGGQHLIYQTAPVTNNGEGGALSEAVSNEMGQIARLGINDLMHGDEDGAIAANGAIWALEYGVAVTSPNATIQAEIEAFVANTHDDGRGWAQGLVDPLQGYQAQILPSAIPEPPAWLLMALGAVILGRLGKAVRT